MTLSIEMGKVFAIACLAILAELELLPRFLLVPIVSCGAVQLWSLQSFLRETKAKKIDDDVTCLPAAIVQASCDRRTLSIIGAVVLMVLYSALGNSIKSCFFLNAVAKSAIAFVLGALCSAALPQDKEQRVEEEEPSTCSCGMKCGSSAEELCPYSNEFWADLDVPEQLPDTYDEKELIDVLFLQKKR
mmetsp:Transcript_63211/g.77375  ORF Transcript_63211/g.77375 Transcript_63211/m.77375 type:complete len:188 (-) Transcript_63211:33-596(-)